MGLEIITGGRGIFVFFLPVYNEIQRFVEDEFTATWKAAIIEHRR
jgi:hypothetical protein